MESTDVKSPPTACFPCVLMREKAGGEARCDRGVALLPAGGVGRFGGGRGVEGARGAVPGARECQQTCAKSEFVLRSFFK